MKKLLLTLALALSTPAFSQSPALSNVSKLRDIVLVTDPAIGAKCDGTTNDATAINAALTTYPAVKLPMNATCLITAKITVPDNKRLFGSGYSSVLKKGFNGDMIELGLKAELDHFRMDGNGATFTGRGVLISTGGGGDGWQSIHDMTILDTASYNIEYTATGSGWMSRIENNRLGTYNFTTFAVKYPSPDVNGPRTLLGNVTLGPLADLASAAGVTVVGNNGGTGPAGGPFTIPSIQMNTDLFKAVVVGNSFDSNPSITIKGNLGQFVGNEFNGGYTLGVGATNTIVGLNYGSSGATFFDADVSGVVSNEVYGVSHGYTPAWTATGVAPVYGNATVTGRWQRHGRRVSVIIDIVFGNTTTFGTGVYTFGLPTGVVPAPGSGDAIGIALLVDATGSTYKGVAFVQGSGITVYVNEPAVVVQNNVPVVWAQSDRFLITVDYGL